MPIVVAYSYSISVVATVGNDTYDLGAMETTADGNTKVMVVPATAKGVYLLQNNADGFELDGTTLQVNPATTNYAYNAAGTVRYVLNKASDYAAQQGDVDLSAATFAVTVTAEFRAIQAHEKFDSNSSNQADVLAEIQTWANDLGLGTILPTLGNGDSLQVNTTDDAGRIYVYHDPNSDL